MYYGRKCVAGIVLSLSLCLSQPVCTLAADTEVKVAKSEDANDLFRLYNEAEIEESSELEAEYQALLSKYKDAELDTQQKEIFNSMRDEASNWREYMTNNIEVEIREKMDENALIKSEIEKDISGDWEVLKQLDAKYKMNCNKINSLLEEEGKYTVTAGYVVDYESLDELGREVQDAMETYKAAKDVKVLGDVTNVKFPLGKDTVITSNYGNRIDPMTGTSIRFHAGLDLRASIGTPVLSIFNGIVIDTGYGAAGGYYVKVDHGNGIVSYYCHLSKITCEKGDIVNQYDQIALSGNTGSRTTGPHLHFGLYIDGNSVDPGILFKD